jgi:hypothetical protein
MAGNTTHRHQVISWVSVEFSECVAPDQCVPEAHSHLTDIATCACGAVQRTNVNGEYREIGSWEETNPARTEPTP